METSSNKYVCNKCNKTYKNKSGYWKHNKKYHVDTCKSNVIQKDLQMETGVSPFVSPFVSPSAVKISHTNITTNDGYSCDYCGIIYAHRQSKYKHQLKCKNKTNNIIKLLVEQIKTQKEQIIEIKESLTELINKNCKVHPKTLQKINKQLNGDHNIINENNGTINNNTFNNTFNIIALGTACIEKRCFSIHDYCLYTNKNIVFISI
jgi:hypothetical protein